MRMSARDITSLKGQRPITLLSAYDAITASMGESAGADVLLVGDSVGIEMLGYGSVIPVSLAMILHHVSAVVRSTSRSLVVADMPLGDYGVSPEDTARHAVRLVKEGGAQAVKIAGGMEVLDDVKAIRALGIPVMGHVGVNSSHASLGETDTVVGVSREDRARIVKEAEALESAGCFALIAKCVPPSMASELTDLCRVPIISIGSGKADGVGANTIDLLGFSRLQNSWFSLKRFDGRDRCEMVLKEFIEGVKIGTVTPHGRETASE